MAKSKKVQEEVLESDIVVHDDIAVEMSQLGIMDWSAWHKLSVPAVMKESDDVEMPRENEEDPLDRLVDFLQSHNELPMVDILASCNIDADSLWSLLKDLTAQGYALFITEDQRVLFGMTAMAHLYDKIEAKVVTVEKPGRKSEVLALLQSHTAISIPQMAKMLGITERNISSQLSYLRKDGHLIGTNSRGWKVLEKSA